MDTQKFMSLSALEKVELVNKMLNEEDDFHLKNVASKLGLSESTLSKIIRQNSSYQYNKTSKQYDRIMPIEEYKKYLQTGSNENKMKETLQFVAEHLEELKELLHAHENELILEHEIYDPSSKTITRTIQVNEDIYKEFSDLYSSRFQHIRLREVYSKCLLDFIKTYKQDLNCEIQRGN